MAAVQTHRIDSPVPTAIVDSRAAAPSGNTVAGVEADLPGSGMSGLKRKSRWHKAGEYRIAHCWTYNI